MMLGLGQPTGDHRDSPQCPTRKSLSPITTTSDSLRVCTGSGKCFDTGDQQTVIKRGTIALYYRTFSTLHQTPCFTGYYDNKGGAGRDDGIRTHETLPGLLP